MTQLTRVFRYGGFAAAIALLIGCNESTRSSIWDLEVYFMSSDSSFRAGETTTIYLQMVNPADGSVTFTMPQCPPSVQVEDQQGLRVGLAATDCDAVSQPAPTVLEPGRSVLRTYTWNGRSRATGEDLPPGEYRVRGYLTDDSGKEWKFAGPDLVIEPPVLPAPGTLPERVAPKARGDS